MAKIQIMGTDQSTVADVNPSGALEVDLEEASSIIPIDVQTHLQTTIQTQTGVSVAATTGTNDSSWIDTDGYTEIAINLLNAAATANQVDLHWSTDGATQQGGETLLASASVQYRSASTPTKARYARVRLFNTDASARVMSAWAYLKA